MSREELLGILSDTQLSDISTKTGIPVNDLKKVNFFKLLKGVELVYTLNPQGGEYPDFQAIGSVDISPPVQNVYATLFDLAGDSNKIVHCLMIKIVNDEVAGRNVTVKFTMDGEVFETALGSLSSGIWYYVMMTPSGLACSGTKYMINVAYSSLYIHTLKIEGKIVEAGVGGNAHMYGLLTYQITE